MPRSPVVQFLSACVALALAGLLPSPASAASVLAKPGDVPEGPGRPHVSILVGWVRSDAWPLTDEGYLWGVRLSVDPSPHFGPFAEFSSGSIRGRRAYSVRVYQDTAYANVTRYDDTAVDFGTLSVGARSHLVARGPVRPYLEVGASVRFTTWDVSPSWYASPPSQDRSVHEDGAGAFVRVGVSTVPWDGVGIWLDGGWEFLAHNPTERAILPVRLGIQF